MEKDERFDAQKTLTLIILELRRLHKEMHPYLTGEETNHIQHLNKAKEYVLFADLARTAHRMIYHNDSMAVSRFWKCALLLTGHKISPELKNQLNLFDRGRRQ